MPQNTEAPEAPSIERFRRELDRLVELFGRNLSGYKSSSYDEASLRQEFLNPFFRALGWDVENKAGLILQHREVDGSHDRMVELVDKMLTLAPKLRAAKADAERATLQNAVTATDRQTCPA